MPLKAAFGKTPGMDGYNAKPVQRDALVETIDKLTA